MKYIVIVLTLLVGFVNAQCDNGTNYYPSFIYTPLEDTWDYASTCNWAGS